MIEGRTYKEGRKVVWTLSFPFSSLSSSSLVLVLVLLCFSFAFVISWFVLVSLEVLFLRLYFC